ncbi:MAG: glycosyltransferase [Thermoguttaceae bacterium]|nr:glycosyltransferase [Thermoguttaceae bacterium]
MKRVGIYQKDLGKTGWPDRWVNSIAQILSENAEVEIVHHNPELDPKEYGEALGVDFSRIMFRAVPVPEWPDHADLQARRTLKQESNFCREYSEPYDLFLVLSNEPPFFSHAKRNILLTPFPKSTFEEYYGHNQTEWEQKGFFSRWWLKKYHYLEWRARFASYQTILCPSQFSREWCWNRWQLMSQVLFPLPRTDFIPAEEKEPLIVSVGDFSAKNKNRQDLLINAFQEFYDRMIVRFDLDEDWRLCLIGNCSGSPEDLAFVEKLRRKAYGYPIEIQTNVDFQTLKNTMSRATFFWSANGYALNENDAPDRVEPFVMTTLEAQISGAIPMIFHTGSAAEVIHHGMNGFLWSNFRELVDMTTAILIEKKILPFLETGAIKNAENFNETAFRENLKKFI